MILTLQLKLTESPAVFIVPSALNSWRRMNKIELTLKLQIPYKIESKYILLNISSVV